MSVVQVARGARRTRRKSMKKHWHSHRQRGKDTSRGENEREGMLPPTFSQEDHKNGSE